MPRPPTFQAINLFQQNHQCQIMGQSLRTQRTGDMTPPPKGITVPICTPYDPGDSRMTCSLPLFPILPPIRRAPGLSFFIQTNTPPITGLLLKLHLFPRTFLYREHFKPRKALNAFDIFGYCFSSPSARPSDGTYAVLQSLLRLGNPTSTEEPSEKSTESGSVRKIGAYTEPKGEPVGQSTANRLTSRIFHGSWVTV